MEGDGLLTHSVSGDTPEGRIRSYRYGKKSFSDNGCPGNMGMGLQGIEQSTMRNSVNAEYITKPAFTSFFAAVRRMSNIFDAVDILQ